MSTTPTQQSSNDVAPSMSAPSASLPKDSDTCCICLETISERAVAVPCNHLQFDFICLAAWVQEHPKCPLCNTTLTSIEYDWAAPHDFKRYKVPQAEPSRPAATYNRSQPRSRLQPGRGGYRGRFTRPCGPLPHAITTPGEAALSIRRHIYHNNFYSLHIGSNRLSRFRDFTPASFAKSPDLQSRARTFIRRELGVFDFSHQTVEFLITYIGSILRTVELKHSSGKAQELLSEFVGPGHAGLFCHELESWLRSPFARVEDWDLWVQYPRAEATAQDGRSGEAGEAGNVGGKT